MTKITFIAADDQQVTVDATAGQSLMAAALNQGVGGILAECGGAMMCATCHVYIEEPFQSQLGTRTADEDEMLEGAAAEVRATSRLACQIVVTPALEGMQVYLPDSQL